MKDQSIPITLKDRPGTWVVHYPTHKMIRQEDGETLSFKSRYEFLTYLGSNLKGVTSYPEPSRNRLNSFATQVKESVGT